MQCILCIEFTAYAIRKYLDALIASIAYLAFKINMSNEDTSVYISNPSLILLIERDLLLSIQNLC